jgi:hypothetical protein
VVEKLASLYGFGPDQIEAGLGQLSLVDEPGAAALTDGDKP